jgi:hypothetical protein
MGRAGYLLGGAALGIALTVVLVASQDRGNTWVCAYSEGCATLTDCPVAALRADVSGKVDMATVSFEGSTYPANRRQDAETGVYGYVSSLLAGDALFLTIQPSGASLLSIHHADPARRPIATARTLAGRCTEGE